MDIQTKDGILLRGIPDGTPEEAIRARLKSIRSSRASEQVMGDQVTKGALNFAQDMSAGEQMLAGAGGAFKDIMQGAGQIVGLGPSRKEVDERRDLDVPLLATPGGFTGKIGGGVASTLPAIFAGPGMGAAIATGAGYGGLQPVGTDESRLVNAVLGGVTAGALKAGADKGANYLATALADKGAKAAQLESQNAVRDATLAAAREEGYITPPSAVRGSWLNKRIESIGGKAAIGQEAAARNQGVTDALARRASGLAPDEAISETALTAASRKAAAPYREVSAQSPEAAAALDAWRAANLEAKLQFTHFNKSGDPAAYKAAQAAQAQAAQSLDQIEAIARDAGNTGLVQALKQARVQIAKIHDVERALNVGSGSVDASVLGRALDRGAPLTGELKTIAQFQQAFPSYAREASRIPTPGVSKSEALASALLALGGYGAAGPVGAVAGTLPLLSGPARSLALSPAYQKLMASPQYQAGGLPMRLAAELLNNPQLQRMLTTAGALGAVESAQ